MRKVGSTKSYWWLKTIIILAVILSAYLLITKQYMILIEIIICVVGGYVLYRVLKHRLENPRPHKAIGQSETKPNKTEKQPIDDEEIDISQVSSKALIDELTKRNEVRIR